MLKKIFLLLILFVVGVLVYATTKPNDIRVERSITIKAPAAKVFAMINDFHQWPTWSPWEKKDPNMKREHKGAAAGKGAIYAWEGNSDVGQGSMEITDSVAPTKVVTHLAFLKPFKSESTGEFALTENAGTTTVKWSMYGPANYLSKVMCVFMNMDKMIGGDFEQGLANMKATAEK